MLSIIITLRCNNNFIGNKESRVETDSERIEHADVGARGEAFREGPGPAPRVGSQVVHESGLGRSDARVDHGEGVVGLRLQRSCRSQGASCLWLLRHLPSRLRP